MKFLEFIKGKVIFNEPLKKHTTFKIGGNAAIWFEPYDKNDLVNILEYCRQNKKKYFIIGEGSNLLIKENGFNGVAIHLNSSIFKQIRQRGDIVYVGAGISVASLIRFALKNSLSGIEFLSGMPGSVGGAIAMNVGTHSPDDFSEQHDISGLLESVELIDKNNRSHKVSAKKLKFAYRKSNLNDCIILGAEFRLKHSNKKEINKQIHKYLDYRMKTQDYSHPSAGCIFKNPKGISAGFLIDASGLKGKRVGNAMISKKHANFIVNLGGASSNSVLRLIDLTKNRVKENFGLELQPEIIIIGN